MPVIASAGRRLTVRPIACRSQPFCDCGGTSPGRRVTHAVIAFKTGNRRMSESTSNFMARQGFFLLPLFLALAACAGNGEGLDQNGEPISGGPPPNTDFAEIQ